MAPVLEAVRYEDLTPRLGDDDEGRVMFPNPTSVRSGYPRVSF